MGAIMSFLMGILGIGFIRATSGVNSLLGNAGGFFMDGNPFGSIGSLGTIFAVVFTIICFASAVYNLINAVSKNRLSDFDITSHQEEADPLNNYFGEKNESADKGSKSKGDMDDDGFKYCPSCGSKMSKEYEFCPSCGEKQP